MWMRLVDRKGEVWDVNNQGIAQVCFAWGRSRAVYHNARVVSTNSRVAGLWKAVGASVEVDWPHARNMGFAYGSREYERLRYRVPAQIGFANVASELARMRENTVRSLQLMQRHYDEVTRINANTISSMTKNAEVARMTRDVAATSLVCLATGPVATSAMANAGVWAAGGLSTGAVIKGVGKYQDTGNVAAGVVECGFELLFGFIPIGAGKAGIDDAASIALAVFCKAPAELAKSAVAGESVWKGAAAGGVEILAAIGGPAVKAWLDKKALPIVVRALKGSGTVNRVVVTTGKKVVGGALDVAEGNAVDAIKAQAADAVVQADPKVEYARSMHKNHQPGDSDFIKTNCLRYVGRG